MVLPTIEPKGTAATFAIDPAIVDLVGDIDRTIASWIRDDIRPEDVEPFGGEGESWHTIRFKMVRDFFDSQGIAPPRNLQDQVESLPMRETWEDDDTKSEPGHR